jgi:hypothetical protein
MNTNVETASKSAAAVKTLQTPAKSARVPQKGEPRKIPKLAEAIYTANPDSKCNGRSRSEANELRAG